MKLDLPNSDISYFPDYLNSVEADSYFELLRKNVHWQQDDIGTRKPFVDTGRNTALMAISNTKNSKTDWGKN